MGCAQSVNELPVPCIGDEILERPGARTGFHKRYTMGRKLGEGSFGTVYSITDEKDERPDEDLVVKVLDLCCKSDTRKRLSDTSDGLFSPTIRTDTGPGKPVLDAKRENLFKNEVLLLQKVSSIKYCVRIVDFFCEGCNGLIVMERFDIELPAAMMRAGKNLNERSFVTIARDMLAGLAAIHDLAIVHQDVKPDNFAFSQKSGILKLLDFGLSTCLTDNAPFAKCTRGTAPFMSPEMLTQKHYGVESDIWAVGVCFYAILLGAFPYMPRSPSKQDMKNLIRVGSPLPTFRAFARTACLDPSSMSIDLLRTLIDRDHSTRATAKSALKHVWFTVSESTCHSSHSLQPSLVSARRFGAFNMPLTENVSEAFDHSLTKLLDSARRKQSAPVNMATMTNECRQFHKHSADQVQTFVQLVPL